ncbi:efflux RND transporter periplasmic adaptor subunit [Candidatus Microgenomates bacterium]|nr:efflux RND transporter periplasmic adaptor subunit [Candidatus Microgenomates bacterium]
MKNVNFRKKISGFLKKRWKLALVLLVVIVGGFFYFSKKNGDELETATVQKGNIKEELILSGTVSATNYAQLAFETSGKIVYVGVLDGEEVKKGRLLSKLDTTLLNSEYQKALSDRRYTQANVENVHDQVKDNETDESYAQKDTRTYSEVANDKAWENVIKAKRSLDGASLYAPFDGIITSVAYPFSGVNILATIPQIEIIDPTTMYMHILADQTEVTKLSVGQKVEVILDSFDEDSFEGKIETISFTPMAGESGSSYSVKVSFIGVDLLASRFKIGMTGDAKFTTAEKDDVLYIPSGFVNSDKEGKFVRTNGKNGKVYVEVGLESEDDTQISGSIHEGLTLYD